MILESFNICQNVAEKNQLDYDLVKSINDSIFKGLNERVRNPESLITCFSPFGNFYCRKKEVRERLKGINSGNSKRKELPGDDEFKESLIRILEMYSKYDEDNLNFKYAKFGKESHDAFILAKKTQRIPFSKKDKHP